MSTGQQHHNNYIGINNATRYQYFKFKGFTFDLKRVGNNFAYTKIDRLYGF